MKSLIDTLNAWAGEWGIWFGHAGWQSAVVAAVLLGVVWAGRRWPAPLRYGLLLVALIKFAVPPMYPLPSGVFSQAGPALTIPPEGGRFSAASWSNQLTASSAGLGEMNGDSPQIARPPILSRPSFDTPPARPLRWPAWLMLAHGLGSVAAAIWILRQWRRLSLLKRTARRVTGGNLYHQFQEVAGAVGVRRLPALLISSDLAAPIAFGLIRPAVLLPAVVTERLPRAELRTILAHELAHCRRGDLWVNSLQLGLLVVWWFHPLLWILHRAIRIIREDCCDDLLLARDVTSSGVYCDVLVRSARELALTAPSAAALGFGENLHPLGRRLVRIMDDGLKRSAKLSLGGLLVIAITGGLLLPGLRSQPIPPVPAQASTEPVKALEQSRDAAAAKIKRYEEEDRQMMRRLRIPPPRNLETAIIPEIKALSVPELFERMKARPFGSKRQDMLREEFLARKEGALSFLADQFAQPHSSVAAAERLAKRRKSMTVLASLAGRFRGTLPGLLPVLESALKDSDPQIAEAAARSLPDLGPEASPVVPALLEALRRGNGQAVLALTRLAPDSEEVLKVLLEIFQDHRQPIALRTTIVQAVANTRIKPHRDAVERAFLAEFPAADRRLQHKIAFALLRSGSQSPEAAVAVQKAITHVERALVSGEFADLTVPELIEYVREPRAYFEDVEAASKLQSFLREAAPAVPALIEMLRDKSRPMRGAAAGGLANIGPAAKPAVPALLEFLNDKSEPDRSGALAALQGVFCGDKDPTPIPAFVAALDDEDESVRQYAAHALGAWGPAAGAAVPKLLGVLKSEDGRARLAAASAIWRMDSAQCPKLVPVLMELVGKPDQVNESANGARLLGEMGASAAAAVPLLKRVAADAERDDRTREEARKALSKIETGATL